MVADDPAGDLRLSLHARLADAGTVVASAPAADAPVVPPPPAARPVTGTVDEARARFLGRTASATRDFDAPATPLDEATEEL